MYVILFQVQYNLVLLDMLSIIKLQFSSVHVFLTSKLCLPGGGELPVVGYTGRLHPKEVPFLSSQYIKS